MRLLAFLFASRLSPAGNLKDPVRMRGCWQGQWKQKGFGLVEVKDPEGIFLQAGTNCTIPEVKNMEQINCTLGNHMLWGHYSKLKCTFICYSEEDH